MDEGSFRQSMAWLHTWAGLLPGWLLFVIFLFGSAAFFRPEVTRWMEPELNAGFFSQAGLDGAFAFLREAAPQARSWAISLPSPRGGALSVSWESTASGSATLDPATGRERVIRDTAGGDFLYRFHFDLHYMPWWLARRIVSVSALAMFVAILSGIVTHKKIFADFFLLRFGKGQRSWLDAHNVTGVLALPFHLMMTYTGLVTLLFTLMPWAISANFANSDAFYEAAYPAGPKADASGKPAPMLSLRALVAEAEAQWQGAPPGYISISHPGDAASIVEMYSAQDRLGGDLPVLRVSGVTGRSLGGPTVRSGPAVATQDVMVQLHRGAFAGPVLRWMYFLSGVGGTVMIASGLVLWTVKRRAKLPNPGKPQAGFKLVERLNIGVLAGAPAGIADYFLANRLLPLDVAHRADWEINSLFTAWGAVFAWTLARPAKRAWVEALVACALLYTAVPIVNAVTTTRGLVPSLAAGDWVFAGFDLTMLAVAGVFAFTAWKVAIHTPGTKSSARRKAMQKHAGAAT